MCSRKTKISRLSRFLKYHCQTAELVRQLGIASAHAVATNGTQENSPNTAKSSVFNVSSEVMPAAR